MAMFINDNVYKNLHWGQISVSSFDPNALIHKDVFTSEEKQKLTDGLLNGESQSKVEQLTVE